MSGRSSGWPTASVTAFCVTAALLVVVPSALAAPSPPDPSGVDVAAERSTRVPRQLIVRFARGVGPAGRAEAHTGLAARVVDELLLPRTEVVRLERGLSLDGAIARYERDPRVLYAEPNVIRSVDPTIPNDPSFVDLWGLHNTGQTVNGVAGTADADIDAPEAWDVETGDAAIVVGVMDTGIAYDHPDLVGNRWLNPGETVNGLDDDGNGLIDDRLGWDWVNSDADPRDDHGHGSHVAGTIGAVGNDGIGVAGVNWDVSLAALKVCDLFGACSSSAIADALVYAGTMGFDVVNGSLSGPAFSQTEMNALTSAPDTLFVFAAGNGGADQVGDDNDGAPRYPCAYPQGNVLCVAATTQSDGLASFSNYGATTVDLGAPGTNILSAAPDVDTPFSEDFETDFSQWTTGGTNNTWTRAGTADHYMTDGTALFYAANTNSWARTASSFDLSQREGCRLDYEMELDVGSGDILAVEASTDAVNWTVLSAWYGSTSDQFWPFTEDLTVFDGASAVYLRYRLQTNATGLNDGAKIDDVVVSCVSSDGAYAGDEYAFMSGTSMATPHVAGAAALLWAGAPTATLTQVRNATLAGVDPLAALTAKTVTGGRLNLAGSQAALAASTATHRLTVVKRGAGTGTVTSAPAGISCPSDCSEDYASSPSVVLSAAPSDASLFDGWSGEGCSGTGTCTVTMDHARHVEATFTTPWPMFQHDARHTGLSPYIGPLATPTVDWTFSPAGQTGNPVMAPDGTIYVPAGMNGRTTQGWLYALNPDGSLRWTYTLDGPPSSTAPAIGPDGTIYVHANGPSSPAAIATLTAINPNGTKKWEFEFNDGAASLSSSLLSSPAVGPDGTVWVGAMDTGLYALDPAGSVRCAVSPSATSLAASPAFADDGTLYINDGWTLFAIGPDCGERWSYQYASVGPADSSPVVGPDGTIYVGDAEDQLNGVYPDGTPRCTYQSNWAVRGSAAIGPTGRLYVIAGSPSALVALDADCNQQWTYPSGDPFITPIVGADGTVYFRDSFNLRAVAPNGTLRWSMSFGGSSEDSPRPGGLIGSDGRLFYGDVISGPTYRFRALELADTTAPTVTGVTSPKANGAYTTGEVIDVEVTFSEAVIVDGGTPTLTLETGDTDAAAAYHAGSGTDTLTFRYTVASGHTSSDLDYTGTGALMYNGSTLKDAAGNDANKTLPVPGAAGSLSANKDLVIDTTPPTVTIDSGPSGPTNDNTPTFTYSADEPVAWTCDGGACSETGTHTYPVLPDGPHTFTVRATDAAGNYFQRSRSFTVDTVNPTNPTLDSPSHDVGVPSKTKTIDVTWSGAADTGGTGVDGYSYVWDAASGTVPDTTKEAEETVTGTGAYFPVGGSYWFHLRTRDNAGNWSSTVHLGPFVIDITAPTVTGVTSSKADGAYTTGEVIDVEVTFSEAVIVDGGTPSLTLETGDTDAAAAYHAGSGTSTLTFRYTVAAGHTSPDLDYTGTGALMYNGSTLKDAAGNDANKTLPVPGAAGSLGANEDLVIDTTAPVVTLDPVSSPTNDATPEFTGTGGTLTGDDPAVTLRIWQGPDTSGTLLHTYSGIALDGSGNWSRTVPDADALTDGTYTARAEQGDGPGNQGFSATRTFTVDLSPGAPTDLGQFRSDGTTSIAVGGFTDQTEVKLKGTVTTPDLNRSVFLQVEVKSVGTTFDGSGLVSGTARGSGGVSTATVSGLSDASYHWRARTVDNYGYPSDWVSFGGNDEADADLTVDTVNPANPTLDSPSHTVGVPLNDQTVDVTWTGAADTGGTGVDGYSFAWSTASDTIPDLTVDAQETESGTTSSALPDGSHWFHLRTRDNAGNWSGTTHLGPFVIDITAPTVTGVTSPKPDGAYTAGEVIDVEVVFSEAVIVDGGTPSLTLETGGTDASAPYHAGSGTPTLVFRYTVAAGHTSPDLDYTGTGALMFNGSTLKDAAGNNADKTLPVPGAAGSLGANKDLVIDTTAPATSIDSGPSGPTNDATPTFTFSADEPGSTFECLMDADPFATCTSPYEVSPALADGPHTFEVRATDPVGNTGSPDSRTFTVDTGTPTDPTLDSPSHEVDVASNDDTVEITWSGAADLGGTGVDGFSYEWSTAADTTPNTTKDAEGTATGTISDPLADGDAHWFHLRTVDTAGNWTSTVHLGPFVIDTDPPETTILTGPEGYVYSYDAEFTFESDEPGSTFECDLDGTGWESCTSPKTYSGLADGYHEFSVRATDAAGNTDPTPDERYWEAGAPVAKKVTLKASKTAVPKGTRVRLTAIVKPCPDVAGELVRFQRKVDGRWRTFVTKTLNDLCRTVTRVTMRKTTVFRAVSPRTTEGFLRGISNVVRVRVV